jgi:hypothetical protein
VQEENFLSSGYFLILHVSNFYAKVLDIHHISFLPEQMDMHDSHSMYFINKT